MLRSRRHHLGWLAPLALLLLACGAPAPAPTAAPTKPAAPATAAASPAAKATTAASPAAATAAPTAAPAAKPATKTLKVGVQPNSTYAPFVVAMERGYFDQAGIKIEQVTFGSGAESIAPLATNDLDVAVGGISAGLFNALGRGVDIKIISDFSRMAPGFGFGGLLVAKNSGIKEMKDLKGKRVAFNSPGAPCHYMIGKGLQTAGLSLDDITISNIPFPSLPGAFQKGEIDAACGAEPWVTNTTRGGFADLLLTYDTVIPNMQVSVTMISPNLAKDRELVQRYLQAFLKAVPEASQKSPEVLEMTAKYTKLDASVLKDTYWSTMDPKGKMNLESIKDQLDFFKKANLVQGTIDLDKAIDESYLPK